MKKTLLLIVALSLVFGLAGCGTLPMMTTVSLNGVYVDKSVFTLNDEPVTTYFYATKGKVAINAPVLMGYSIMEKYGVRGYYMELSSSNTKNLQDVILTIDGTAFVLPLALRFTGQYTYTLHYLLSPQALAALQNAKTMELMYANITYVFVEKDIVNIKLLSK